jgi:adenylate cyclase
MIDLTEFQDRGLYDPAAPNAADRLALLRWLEAQGVTPDEMAEANSRGLLTAVVSDRVFRPGGRFELAELARRAGMTEAQIERLRRATGLPLAASHVRVFTEDDVQSLVAFRAGAEMFGERATLQFVRVIGSGLARVAEAAVSLFLSQVQQPLMAEHPSELALAKANLEARQLLVMVSRFLDKLFRVHTEEAIRRSRQERIDYDTSQLAIGFVDLVGFTPLAQQLPMRELAALVDDFEARAFDVAIEQEGRVVKLIGDELMFVAPSAAAGCEIALTLAEGFRDRPGITPRGGVAVGALLMRGGDYYGPVVNLAARLAELAIPHEILVTPPVQREAQRTRAPLTFAPAGRRLLKGFAEPLEVFAVARAEAA